MIAKIPKFTLFYIHGIPVKIDITVLIVPLILYGLPASAGREPDLAFIVATTLGLLFSLLLHELGHALTGRTFGLPVKQVVLGGLIGYAQLGRRKVSREKTLAILAAGPATNILLFLLVWIIHDTPPLFQFGKVDLSDSSRWFANSVEFVAYCNLILFVVNILPVLPLDGGRILTVLLRYGLPELTTAIVVAVSGLLTSGAVVIFNPGYGFILTLFGIWLFWVNLRLLLQLSSTRLRKRT